MATWLLLFLAFAALIRRSVGELRGDFFCLGGGDGDEVERNFDFVFHLESAAGDGDSLNSVVGLAKSELAGGAEAIGG
jgi:hypothetical protein